MLLKRGVHLIAALAALWLVVASEAKVTHGAPVETSKFAELSREDAARLEKQRGVIGKAVLDRYGVALTRSKADLSVLQRLLNDGIFQAHQTYELQCLGVAFGDAVVAALPLRWTMVTDEYGTDPTLRYRETSFHVNALTMISKRVERGEEVDLQMLLHWTGEQVAEFDRRTRQ